MRASRYSANNNFAPSAGSCAFYFCIFLPARVPCTHRRRRRHFFVYFGLMRVQLKYVYIINGALPYLFYDTDRADFTPKYVNQM